jgi:hypothetical protein
MTRLKKVFGSLGMRFDRYREVTVHLGSGRAIRIRSPYFVSTAPRRGRKKRGPRGPHGAEHKGLSVLGFMGFYSGNFVSEVVKLALLCPSFEVAGMVLSERGIAADVKTIRRLCRELGLSGLELRGSVSTDGTEDLKGYTLVIGIDGGRLRERRKKRGRKKKGQKRRGFHAEWREPKLFIIYVTDAEGKTVKDFPPLQDATLGRGKAVFDVLKRYLNALGISKVTRAVFCGDGNPGIWKGAESLCGNLGTESDRIYQVLDYTHAKQNLTEITDLIPHKLKNRNNIIRMRKDLLWEGDISGLYRSICSVLKGKRKKDGLKKWENYFYKNQKRMKYRNFRDNHIPCGSGSVESAIRRVINLRLKSAGSFWKEDMAECFLFLRSQLLSGRWLIFMKNAIPERIKFFGEKGLVIPFPLPKKKNCTGSDYDCSNEGEIYLKAA